MFVCSDSLMVLFPCRVRRRFARGLKRKHMALLKRLRKAKKEAPALEKPEVILCYIEIDFSQEASFIPQCLYKSLAVI